MQDPTTPSPAHWEALVEVAGKLQRLRAIAYTKSEAKARFKEQLGLPRKARLPIGVSIDKIRS